MRQFVCLALLPAAIVFFATQALARSVEIRASDAVCVRENLEKYLALPDDPVILVQGSCPNAIGVEAIRGKAGPKVVKKPKAFVLRKSELRCIAEAASHVERSGQVKGVLRIDLSVCK